MRRPTSARHDIEPCSHSPRAAALPPPYSSHVTPAPRSPLGPPDQAGSSSSPPTSERRRTLPYGDTRQSIRRLTANMSRRGTGAAPPGVPAQVAAALPGRSHQPRGGRRSPVHLPSLAPEPMEVGEDDKRDRAIARGVQTPDQDTDRAALGRNRRDA